MKRWGYRNRETLSLIHKTISTNLSMCLLKKVVGFTTVPEVMFFVFWSPGYEPGPWPLWDPLIFHRLTRCFDKRYLRETISSSVVDTCHYDLVIQCLISFLFLGNSSSGIESSGGRQGFHLAASWCEGMRLGFRLGQSGTVAQDPGFQVRASKMKGQLVFAHGSRKSSVFCWWWQNLQQGW